MTITFQNPRFGAFCRPMACHPGARGKAYDRSAQFLYPRVNVVEKETVFTIYVFLPGVRKEDVSVTVSEKRVLTIKGEKRREETPEGAEFRRNERRFGSFKREFQLPETVSTDSVKASMENGVLEITLEKIPQKATNVEIQ